MLTALTQSAAVPDLSRWSNWNPASTDAAAALRSMFDQPLEVTFSHLIATLSYVQAAVFIVAGLVYLLYGYKVFRVLVVINAAVLGAWAGYWVSAYWKLDWWPIAVGAAVLAVIAWPLIRAAVCITGCLAGALLGTLAARSLALDGPAAVAAAVIGMLVLGVLALVIFKVIIIASTAVQGSMMAVVGVAAVVAKFEGMSSAISQALKNGPFLLPVLVLVPALVGMLHQFRRAGRASK